MNETSSLVIGFNDHGRRVQAGNQLSGIFAVVAKAFVVAVAVAFFQGAVLAKDSVDPLTKADNLMRKNYYLKLLPEYDREVARHPCYGVYCGRATVNNWCERYKEAIADADRAIKLSPDKWGAYRERALAYKGLRQFVPALCDADKSYELSTTSFERAYALMTRAAIYNDVNAVSSTVADLDCAVALAPNDGVLRIMRAHAFCRFGLYERAIKDCCKAMKLINPNLNALHSMQFAAALRQRADVLQAQGRTKLAEQDRAWASQIMPNEHNTIWTDEKDLKQSPADRIIEWAKTERMG